MLLNFQQMANSAMEHETVFLKHMAVMACRTSSLAFIKHATRLLHTPPHPKPLLDYSPSLLWHGEHFVCVLYELWHKGSTLRVEPS